MIRFSGVRLLSSISRRYLQMDILTQLLEAYQNWIGSLPLKTASFILRATLLFGLATAVTACLFQNGSRSIVLQVLAFIVTVFITALFPVHAFGFLNEPRIKSWILTLCVLALVALPARLPFYLTPNKVHQKRLSQVFYGSLLTLFLFN